MDQRQLQIVLKLQDEASKELRKLSGELNNVEGQGHKTGGMLTSLGGVLKTVGIAAAAATAAFVTFGIKTGVQVAAQLQTAQVGLETLLGSAEAAEKTIERLKKEAARTPFELPGLSQAVQLLTSVTKNGDRSIDIILDVGEALAAMGKGQAELDRIIVNLQQIAATGRAATIDIKQFAFAGIPIYEMLAETTGKTGEELAKLIEDGGVTFDLLTKMFDDANNAGGRFFGAFENQSGTFNQALSNLKDSFGIFFADIVKGSGLFDGLTSAMMTAASWLGNYREHLENMKTTIQEWIGFIEQKTGLITLMKDAWANVVFMFNEQLKPALLELWETLQPYKPYLEALAQVLGYALVGAVTLVVMVLGALAAGLIQVLTWLTKVADFLAGVFLTALNFVKDAITAVVNAVERLIERLKEAWEWATKVIGKAGAFIGNVKEGVSNAVSTAGNAIGNAATSAKNAVVGLFTGKADGGPVTGGTPYVVGERGPELFVPRTNGTIVPNGGMGGVNVNVTVNGDVSGQELVERVQEAIMNGLRMNTKLAL